MNLTTPRIRNALYKISYPPRKKSRGRRTGVIKSKNVDIELKEEIRIELLYYYHRFVFLCIIKLKLNEYFVLINYSSITDKVFITILKKIKFKSKRK